MAFFQKMENITELLPQQSLLQPFWDFMKANGREKYLASPLWPIFMSVGFYFLLVFPFMIFDLFGHNWKWIRKYKIQVDKPVTWEQTRKALLLTLWNHAMFILPTTIAQHIWVPDVTLPDTAPGLGEFLGQLFAMMLIFDFQYFVWHALHHKFRFLYRYIHAIHHEYSSPFCWVTQYLHPWELITVGLYTTTLPWVFKSHCLTTWGFMITNIITSVEAHHGYDFPFAGHYWIPYYGGAPKHDMHHQKPLTNYQPYFTHWDKLCGSECPGMAAGGVKPDSLIKYEKERKGKKQG